MPTIVALYLRGFYAAAERRLEPGLGDRPLILCRRQRTLDASPAARARGVRPGLTRAAARRLCPEAAVIDYLPERYRPLAREALDIAAAYTPRIEPLYPHEAFLDLTGCPDPPRAWSQLVDDLEGRGFVPLLGVGSTRFSARAAALCLNRFHRKEVPDVLHPSDEADFLNDLPVAALWPVEIAARQRLLRLGLRRVAEVAAVPPEEIVRQLGPPGIQVARLVRGIDPSRVAALYPPPSLETALPLETGIQEVEPLRQALRVLAGRVEGALRRRREAGYRLSLAADLTERSVESDGLSIGEYSLAADIIVQPVSSSNLEIKPLGQRIDRRIDQRMESISLRSGARSEEELFQAAWRALERLRIDRPVVGLRLRVEELGRPSSVQLDLFGERARGRCLDGLFTDVRRRFGEAALRPGSALPIPRRMKMLEAHLGSYGIAV